MSGPYRVELTVHEGDVILHHLSIDPRCVLIEAGLGRPTRASVTHVDRCNCGGVLDALLSRLPGGVGPDGRPHLGSATGANKEGTE